MTTLSPAFGTFGGKASRRLRLFFSAGLVAFAGLAGTAAPAQSQSSDELIRFLLGAAAVAVVVRAIDSSASSTRSRGQLARGVLPEACMERVRLRGRHVDVYHTGCLGWYGIDRLPRRCETPVRTDRGMRSYHLAQCLHESGWRPQYAAAPSRPRHDWTPPRAQPRHDRHPPRAHRRRDCPPGWQWAPRRHQYSHCERGRW